ncbi:MAG: hypothetical protein QG665_369 [Patescibacteria group bacterium]|nr:hypothetical protein [Patescibacteria group bacterium]
MKLEGLVEEMINGWGERPIYVASADQIKELVALGAAFLRRNEDGGDGIYRHELLACGKKFMGSTLEPI